MVFGVLVVCLGFMMIIIILKQIKESRVKEAKISTRHFPCVLANPLCGFSVVDPKENISILVIIMLRVCPAISM
jgi:hypothetical protein